MIEFQRPEREDDAMHSRDRARGSLKPGQQGLHPFRDCAINSALVVKITLQSGRSSGVEHNLAKVRVGRSNRLARSN
jgi:hypothetical protein